MKIWFNSALNIAGLVVPTVLSIPAMGYLAREFGAEKFVLFLLIFTELGYASILDFGLNRALVLNFARIKNDSRQDSTLFFTGSVFVLVVSLFPGLIFFFFTGYICALLNVSLENFSDVTAALRVLSLAIPLTLVSFVFLSLLEGKQLFKELNIVKVITGSLIGFFPAIFVFFDNSLLFAVLGILVARVVANFLLIFRCLIILRHNGLLWSWDALRDLLNFGGWITLSNLLNILMGGVDKFVISNIAGAKSAAFYVAATEVTARIGVIPGAIAKTIFPYFADDNNNSLSTRNIYWGMCFILLLVLLPLFFLSDLIFLIWLGEDFSENSSNILKVLLIGFFFNAMAQIPFSKIQARGLSKLTTIIHAFETVPYLILLFFLLNKMGVMGAAYAWSFRVIFDFFILEYFRYKRGV